VAGVGPGKIAEFKRKNAPKKPVFSPQTALFAYKTAALRTASVSQSDDFASENEGLSLKNACFPGFYAETTTG